MAAFRRRVGTHPFIGGFVGLILFVGVSNIFRASLNFTLLMTFLGFMLGMAMFLILGGKWGHYDEIDKDVRDARCDADEIRNLVPYNHKFPPSNQEG